MLTKRLIPSLLLRNGRLVKGKQCRDYRDAGNPATTIRALYNQGADEIVLLNIGLQHDWESLRAAASGCFVPITYGGLISCEDDARNAFLNGADKIYLGGSKIALAHALSRMWGIQAIVLGLDVHWRQELPDWQGEIRLLDVAHEGTRQGIDPDLIRWASKVGTPLIVEGGIGNLDHIAQAFRAGADAVALGAMLTFSDANIVKLKRHLHSEGFCVRL